jgi:putative sterol carrier protein
MAVSNVMEAVEAMKSRFNAGAASGMNAVYQVNLSGAEPGSYYLAINDGQLETAEGTHDSPNITINMASNDFVAMTNGQLNPTMAYMSGKLKIAGDMGLAMKMQNIFPNK